jgi:hypothetical protein
MMITYEVRFYDGGDKVWYLEGKLHRTDGPAVEYSNGTKVWYLKGKRHRINGPAVEYSDGAKMWYLEGKELTEEQHKARTTKGSCVNKVVTIDGVDYVLKEK